MSQVSPRKIIEEGALRLSEYSKISQNGIDCSLREEIKIPSKGFLNILLNEEVKIPKEYFMTLCQRSTYSRQGVFVTSGIFDSGFEGSVGCSIYNMSEEDITIPANTRILQVVFWEADDADLYNGRWQNLK